MQIKKIELCSFQRVLTYEVEDGDIIDNFGSIDRFHEVLDGFGQPPEEEEAEMLSNILSECQVDEDNIMGDIEESFFEYTKEKN